MFQKLGISRKVVSNLRNQPADIDGIGGGKQPSFHLLFTVVDAGKSVLYTALAVVKVPAHRANAHIFSFLRDHLRFLHGRNASVREKDGDICSVHIMKAFQRCLAGIAGCGGKDGDGFRYMLVLPCGSNQQRQNRKSYILESRGGSMVKLQRKRISYSA